MFVSCLLNKKVVVCLRLQIEFQSFRPDCATDGILFFAMLATDKMATWLFPSPHSLANEPN